MTEGPTTKRTRRVRPPSGGEVRLIVDETTRTAQLKWVFEVLPCKDERCLHKGLFADDKGDPEWHTHKPVVVDLPSHRIVPAGTTEAGPDKGERTPFYICPLWLDKYNLRSRFKLIKRWRYACALLLREHCWLWPAREALKKFGREYLIAPALKLSE